MSNLLNNNSKKKLLNRGPKITPTQEFKLEEENEPVKTQPKKAETKATEEQPKPKRKNPVDITSVRVTKATRNKLNALIQIGTADSADVLIDIILDEYIENTLTKEQKKTYGIVLDILKKREK